MSFEQFFATAVGEGAVPYAHQLAVAEQGLPTLLIAPTGTGKTETAVLGHLYRRYAHPDAEVRQSTPRWLVMALPTRGLVEQTVERVREWVRKLGPQTLAGPTGGLTVDDVHCVMGGEGWDDRAWQLAVTCDAIFIGTVDMLLSRALNRGYASSRWVWPISFGLFNNGVQWVFDEVQQMELATVTSRQLQAFREHFGTILPTRTMWMSATLDEELLRTVDAAEIPDGEKVDAEGLAGTEDGEGSGLGKGYQLRVNAQKIVHEFQIVDRKKYADELAGHALSSHRPGSLTLVVCNQVKRAQEVYTKLRARKPEADLVLLHRRFRPPERENAVGRALDRVKAEGPGRIVVTTQVLEAGIDVDAATMITEVAPWSSIVQRAGRCNRSGQIADAQLEWVDVTDGLPDKKLREEAAPYDPDDLVVAAEVLRSLEGQAVTPKSLPGEGPAPKRRIHHVLRRRDLLELFDTSPDLSGDVVDVSQFIREGEERDVLVAWRDETGPDMATPTRSELCPVSVDQLRAWMRAGGSEDDHPVFRLDPLGEKGSWVRATPDDLRPGQLYVVPAEAGGYSLELGWAPASRERVPEAERSAGERPDEDQRAADDPASQTGDWYPLEQHLEDAMEAAKKLVAAMAPDLKEDYRNACVTAAALHDLGKAHPVWQAAARNQADDTHPAPDHLVAKTPKQKGRLSFEQPHFRHELASLVALSGYATELLRDCPEPDLCRYLVGAHHGRVRLSIRSVPGEESGDGHMVMLGVVDDSQLPAISTPLGELPEGHLRVEDTAAGWTRKALGLRDRCDLGPFRLAFFEAIVRLADWEASARLLADADRLSTMSSAGAEEARR
ncbi:type I-G CRISPR-associated helicase/endonuclease Cas3g [Rhabdothermincola sediminis]|uniref:type I-G CRISPR-associated helicase/endonuclease Cas3g n=1 Tax=Rhabdothermincola sediminis TaxID=2751370 RepID=UPI001AA065E1|nr:CRISPR-associated helicase Cas3' [Rhabdothermincola sediminis]